jgi:hypothetical protein
MNNDDRKLSILLSILCSLADSRSHFFVLVKNLKRLLRMKKDLLLSTGAGFGKVGISLLGKSNQTMFMYKHYSIHNQKTNSVMKSEFVFVLCTIETVSVPFIRSHHCTTITIATTSSLSVMSTYLLVFHSTRFSFFASHT